MNRRNFIQILAGALACKAIGLKELAVSKLPIHLYGIPYHQSNASMGTWLGISRKNYPIVSTRDMRIPLQIRPNVHKIIKDIEEVKDY